MTSSALNSAPGHIPTQTSDALLTIGEVLAELREEFPELSSSKLRFLEERGLVSPERTPAGYRKFRSCDVDRVRLILVLQRDHHMPLKAIREYLEAYDAGDAETLAAVRPTLAAVGSSSTRRPGDPTGDRPTRLRRREFASLTGASSELLAELEEFGIVVPSAAGFYDQQDLDIVTLAVQMSAYGITARHLRGFQAAADRSVDLVHQLTRPLSRRTDEAVAAAERTHDELIGLCVRMHAAMVGISGSGARAATRGR